MGQSDVYELLKNKRLVGDDSFFSSRQIQKMLSDRGIIVSDANLSLNLRQLRRFGYLDWNINKKNKGNAYNFYVYRLKK